MKLKTSHSSQRFKIQVLLPSLFSKAQKCTCINTIKWVSQVNWPDLVWKKKRIIRVPSTSTISSDITLETLKGHSVWQHEGSWISVGDRTVCTQGRQERQASTLMCFGVLPPPRPPLIPLLRTQITSHCQGQRRSCLLPISILNIFYLIRFPGG